MSIIINFTKKHLFEQSESSMRQGFLAIELLQGLLILGVLLLLVSAYVVLSVHWQHQAIKRFEALNAVSSCLASEITESDPEAAGISINVQSKRVMLPELSGIAGSAMSIEQKEVAARWHDQRGTTHTVRVIS